MQWEQRQQEEKVGTEPWRFPAAHPQGCSSASGALVQAGTGPPALCQVYCLLLLFDLNKHLWNCSSCPGRKQPGTEFPFYGEF